MDITIEQAEEVDRFSFAVTYDGDNHIHLYCTTCNRCGKYFESAKIDVYCNECKKGKING